MKVERIYANDSNLTFEDILLTLVDDLVKEYYDQNRVNTATSHDERKNAA